MDRIADEFIQAVPDSVLQLLSDIINENVENRRTCKEWCTEVIPLIQKEGSMNDPSNYRKLCDVNVLMKILCKMLKNTISLNKEQIWFCQNSKTSEEIVNL